MSKVLSKVSSKGLGLDRDASEDQSEPEWRYNDGMRMAWDI